MKGTIRRTHTALSCIGRSCIGPSCIGLVVAALLAMVGALAPGPVLAQTATGEADGGAGEQAADPLVTALAAVVRVSANIPAGARTADMLGTERQGSGVVIDSSGLVVTIGYLIMEADQVRVTNSRNQSASAQVVGYDHGSGLGLVRVTGLDAPAIPLGSADQLREGAVLAAASLAGPQMMRPVRVVSRRPFAGAWEYLVEDAIFTSPPVDGFGGAALIDQAGRLVGIGSLLVNDAAGGDHPLGGNMFVPIDLLAPIMADLLAHGRPMAGMTPWLGLYAEEIRGHVLVSRVAGEGPAAEAGVSPGDIILGVNGQPVSGLVDYMRKVQALGAPGVEVTLTLVHETTLRNIRILSRDRHDWLRLIRRD